MDLKSQISNKTVEAPSNEVGFSVRGVRKELLVLRSEACSSSRNVDVFNVATRERKGKTICLETFQVKLDGFSNKRFSLCHAGPGGNAPR